LNFLADKKLGDKIRMKSSQKNKTNFSPSINQEKTFDHSETNTE